MANNVLTWQDHVLFDDFLTASLIDNLYYWTKTRKFKHDFPGVETSKSIELITCYLIDAAKPDVSQCMTEFLALPESQLFTTLFIKESQAKLYEFKRHLRRYLQIYLPDCAFEVDTTDRYSEVTYRLEGAIVARKNILPDDEAIKYLTGCLCQVPAEDTDKVSTLSVIDTSRATSLMVGPARFVNHDCDPNCRFVPSAARVLTIVPVRKILPGEEITVYYSDNYFGKGNKDCLCATCERESRGRWKIPELKHVRAGDVLDLNRLSESDKKIYEDKTIDLIEIESSDDDEEIVKKVDKSKNGKSKLDKITEANSSPIRISDSPETLSPSETSTDKTKDSTINETNGSLLKASGSVSARVISSATKGLRNAVRSSKKDENEVESTDFILSTSPNNSSSKEDTSKPLPVSSSDITEGETKVESPKKKRKDRKKGLQADLRALGIIGNQIPTDEKQRVLRGSKPPEYSSMNNRRTSKARLARSKRTKGNITLLDLYNFEPTGDKSATLNFLSSMYNKFLSTRRKCVNCKVASSTVPLCARCKRHLMIYDISWPVVPVTGQQLINKGNYISHVDNKSPDTESGITLDDDALTSGLSVESRASLAEKRNAAAVSDVDLSGGSSPQRGKDDETMGSNINVQGEESSDSVVILSDYEGDSGPAVKTRSRKKNKRNNSARRQRTVSTVSKSPSTTDEEKEEFWDPSSGSSTGLDLTPPLTSESEDGAYKPKLSRRAKASLPIIDNSSDRSSTAPSGGTHKVMNADLTDQSSDDEEVEESQEENLTFANSAASTPRGQKRLNDDEPPWLVNKRESIFVSQDEDESDDVVIIDVSD